MADKNVTSDSIDAIHKAMMDVAKHFSTNLGTPDWSIPKGALSSSGGMSFKDFMGFYQSLAAATMAQSVDPKTMYAAYQKQVSTVENQSNALAVNQKNTQDTNATNQASQDAQSANFMNSILHGQIPNNNNATDPYTVATNLALQNQQKQLKDLYNPTSNNTVNAFPMSPIVPSTSFPNTNNMIM